LDADRANELAPYALNEVFRTADGKEGISAFLGKRKANWKGE